MPIPAPGAFVVKKGVKILPWSSGFTPGPLSRTERVTTSASEEPVTSTRPVPSGEASMAF